MALIHPNEIDCFDLEDWITGNHPELFQVTRYWPPSKQFDCWREVYQKHYAAQSTQSNDLPQVTWETVTSSTLKGFRPHATGANGRQYRGAVMTNKSDALAFSFAALVRRHVAGGNVTAFDCDGFIQIPAQ